MPVFGMSELQQTYCSIYGETKIAMQVFTRYVHKNWPVDFWEHSWFLSMKTEVFLQFTV